MLRFALIGDPVSHSLSPRMHEAAYKELGLAATYECRRVEAGRVKDTLRELWAEGFEGLNVTVPHKLEVVGALVELDAAAEAVGAVNTVFRGPTGWHGSNTDAEGFVRSLPKPAATYERALVLGAGGAARAVVHGLVSAGVRVDVSARRREAAEALGAGVVSWPPLLEAPLVINATSASWKEGDDFANSMRWTEEGGLYVDLAYAKTLSFLRRAESHGAETMDGLGMLVHQGALAFERWTGKTAPVAVMREALVAHLRSPATSV